MCAHLKNLSLLATVISALAANAAHAGNVKATERKDGKKEIEQIVVTGTRTPKSLEDSPVPIDIITAADLQAVTTGTLANALQFIPGVVVTRTAKGGYSVEMQGFDSKRVLVLIDGLPVIQPTNEEADLDQISANNIERIEIVRGASSVLYGSSAMGGVINILTKDYEGHGLKLSAEAGDFGEYHLENAGPATDFNATAHTHVKNWNFKLSGQLLDRPGFRYNPEEQVDANSSLEKKFISFQARTNINGVKLSYQPQFFKEKKARAEGTIPVPGRPTSYYRSSVEQAQHDLFVSGKQHWEVKARANIHNETSGQGTKREAEITNYILDGQKAWHTKSTEIVAGLKYLDQGLNQEQLSSNVFEIDGKSRQATEGFAQVDVFPHKNWNIVAGARLQNDSDFGNHSALRINSLWSPELGSNYNFKWRASLGEGYRVPGLKERFYFFDHSSLGYIVLGNKDLTPETSLTLTNNFSGKVPIGDNDLNIELNIHYSKSDDFIELESDDEESAIRALDVSRYTNISKTKISGADISIGQNAKFRWQLNYSYLDAYDDLKNSRLANKPRHQAKANFWIPITSKQNVLIYGTYEADSYDDKEIINNSYSLLNARWNWVIKDNITWRIGIDNITNTHQKADINEATEFDISPISSRYIFTKIEYSLK